MRVAMFATLASPSGLLEVATTHLSWRPEENEVRLIQAGMMLQEFLANRDSPRAGRVLLGDLNATEDEPAIRLLTEHFRDAYRTVHPGEPGLTWDNRNPLTRDWNLPDRRIDYILCTRETRIRSCDVVLKDPSPDYPSDHCGVFANLEWSSTGVPASEADGEIDEM
jgi:endonuclease/exonuclease/phosphatase family metal-dependent hydrolase